MLFRAGITAFILVASLGAVAPAARAEDRSQLNACQAMVDHAKQPSASGQPDDAQLQRCRQIIREWTSRDQRRSVDEQGRPLR